MPETVRVTGLAQTVRTLERYGADVQDLKAAFTRIGRLVVTKAEARVPRGDKETLARSIRQGKNKNKAVVRAGGARAPYAGFRHYGGAIPRHNSTARTHGAGRHFLSIPADDTQPEAIRLIHEDLERIAKALGL